MELSGNAKRALELIERNLSILYGADYFTEEEWIKIDCLIHKGRYVLSDGPPSNVLEEPLMTFEENKDNETKTVQIQEQEFFSQTKTDSIVGTEETVSSPPSEYGHSFPSPDTTSETPVETSDEDSYPHRTATAEPTPLPAPYSTAEVVEEQPAEIDLPSETSSHLPPGCTQAQLDEVRAFNAGLTKAGKKSRPKYEPSMEDHDEWVVDYSKLTMEEQLICSPPQTEKQKEKRINTWAEGVAKLPCLPPPHQINSPMPSHAPPSAPSVELLAQQFIETHGRQPKSLNDFYQPNNPAYNHRRPSSQVSMRTAKTAVSIKTAAQSAVDKITSGNVHSNSGIKLGKVYTAQSSASRRGIRIEVWPGDHIKIMKFVSGILYIGENLRSKEVGQFPETIFKKDPNTSQPIARTPPSFQRGLDQVENANAAEWDDVSSIRRTETTGPTYRPSAVGGLAASRFSSVAERSPATQNMQSQQGGMSDMAGQIGKIINDKVEEILKARGVGPSQASPPQAPAPKLSTTQTFKLSTRGVPPLHPKTETCWYWSVKNDCRFTAEECRDLHAFVPHRPGVPTNFRNGKPTWGALADSLPSPSSNTHPNIGVIGDGLKYQSKTCYYWAVLKNCSNTAESCKYLHAHSPLGIAQKPGLAKPPGTWKREWRSQYDQEGSQAGEDEHDGGLVLEEVDEVELDGWGLPITKPTESTWGDNKYRPPHIKALEDQAAQEAGGW